MTYSLRILFLAAVCLTSGCAMLPYKDTFDCPQMEAGMCVSVTDAHAHALGADNGGASGKISGGRSGAVSEPALSGAVENYKKAVVRGKPEEIEKRRDELLRMVEPAKAGGFAAALDAFKDAVKSNDPKKISEAENHIRSLHALAVADARDSALLEADLRGEDIRREFLGQYAQGQKAPAVRTPPVIMETYILPYQTEFGTLAGERTLWITVEDAEWVWPDKAGGKTRNDIGSTVRGR